MSKSTTAHPRSRDTRDGRPKGSEQRFLIEGYPCPSSIPHQQPLLMAQGMKAARDTLLLQVEAPPWLSGALASDLARSAASRGGGRAGPIPVIGEISPFLTCKIDRGSRDISLSGGESSNSLETPLSHERASQVLHRDVRSGKALLQSKQPAQEHLRQ